MAKKLSFISAAVTAATAGLVLAIGGCATRTNDDVRASAPQGDKDQQPVVAQAAPTDQSRLPDATGTTAMSTSQQSGWSSTQTAQATQAPSASSYQSGATNYDAATAKPAGADKSPATSSFNGATGSSSASTSMATSNSSYGTSGTNVGASSADSSNNYNGEQSLPARTDRN